MKKFLFMLLMSISVVTFAVPPPLATDRVADEVQFVIQDEVQNIQPAAQEVAFCYLGDYEFAMHQLLTIDQEAKLDFPELVINDELYAQVDELNRPPANTDFTELLTDKQHSNFGYPLTAN